MSYQWIILILLIVLSIVIVFWTYFNHKNNQRLKNVANEFTKNILAMLVIEKNEF
ncbi:hypothetical protein [Spiroplasma eriocheiris]|uniref:Uncharacterized protein n=1 Tax=Spiroplasma eriocheiris TaxID=315358 RepID=A0A0H3XHM1_9MOLU|nr:hypothetical protein [Spiroplasma eriocheiris]AHF57374.1 hypothetical protein SPE_0241 [Spiroplasma eriocheiris CCTCC M 207170]AKM53830.1 hypothetical protein SERIO_v1c02440 [Spiroplasma eriocheiris]